MLDKDIWCLCRFNLNFLVFALETTWTWTWHLPDCSKVSELISPLDFCAGQR